MINLNVSLVFFFSVLFLLHFSQKSITQYTTLIVTIDIFLRRWVAARLYDYKVSIRSCSVASKFAYCRKTFFAAFRIVIVLCHCIELRLK